MGFGLGPFGSTPYGTTPATLPSEDRSSVSSSRLIDGKTKKYVQNAEGGFEPMDDVYQRILLLIAYNVKLPDVIGLDYENNVRQQVRNALKPLTDGPEPEIRITSIETTIGDNVSTFTRIGFYKFRTDTVHTIEV